MNNHLNTEIELTEGQLEEWWIVYGKNIEEDIVPSWL